MSDQIFNSNYDIGLGEDFEGVGEEEIFQTIEGSGPTDFVEPDSSGIASQISDSAYLSGASPLPDNFDLGLGENFQPITQRDIFASPPPVDIDPEQAARDRGYVIHNGRVYRIEDSLIARDFDDQDPFDYDYQDAVDRSFRFLSPEQLGTPEGIEAIYGPTERDPFRQDWSEAEFRIPADYKGEMLTGDEMNVVQQAQNYISGFVSEANRQGFSSVNDYLTAMREYDPQLFNALTTELNAYSGVWDEYGDQYKFQAALHDSRGIADDPMSRNDLIENSISLLRDYVSAGMVSREDAAVLASDPVALVDWLSGGGPSADTPPPPPGGDSDQTEIFFYDDDVDEERPMMRDPATGFPVPYLADNEIVDEDGRVLRFDGNDIIVVRDQYEYPDLPATTTTTTTTTTTSTYPDLDIQGNAVHYDPLDVDKQYPFAVSGGTPVPALFDNEVSIIDEITGRDYILNTDTGERRDVTDYPDFFNFALPSDSPDDGIDLSDLPLDSQGVYDLQADYLRSGGDILGSYFDEDDTGLGRLALSEELRTGFMGQPVYDESLFNTVSQYEYDQTPDHLRATGVRTITIPRTRFHAARTVPFAEAPASLQVGPPEIYYVAAAPKEELSYRDDGVFATVDGARNVFANDFAQSVYRNLVPSYRARSDGPRHSDMFGSGFGWRNNEEVQLEILSNLNDFMNVTGKTLGSIANQEHSDIMSGSMEDDTFDIQQFIFGDEDLGWDGAIDILREEFPSEFSRTNQEYDSRASLDLFAFITAVLTEPLNSRIEREYDSRISGSDYGGNSMPTTYMEMFGPPPRPDHLETYLDLGGNAAGGLVSRMAGGGYIGGAEGGMDDTIAASIDGSQPAALSSGEFVVPADVVSHLGDGNNQNGAGKLYQFLDQIRTVKTGSAEQPDPFNDGIMANMIGDTNGW